MPASSLGPFANAQNIERPFSCSCLGECTSATGNEQDTLRYG